MNGSSVSEPHGTGWYQIRLHGHLDTQLFGWFDGLSLTNEADGTAVIRASVPDQAALHGLLQKVRALGLALVSVDQIDDPIALPLGQDGIPGNVTAPPRRATGTRAAPAGPADETDEGHPHD